MIEKQSSAEKDLLKLIENPGEAELGRAESSEPQSDSKKTLRKISFFSFRKRRMASRGSKGSAGPRVWEFGRRQVLQLLFLITLCVFAYFVMTIVGEYSKTKNTKEVVNFTYVSDGKEALLTHDSPTSPEASVGDVPDLRNIFKLGAVKIEEAKTGDSSAQLSDYRLVGISLEPDPALTYAMVKNVKTNVTFFLKRGEKLDGMELLNILENKIVLRVKGQNVELR